MRNCVCRHAMLAYNYAIKINACTVYMAASMYMRAHACISYSIYKCIIIQCIVHMCTYMIVDWAHAYRSAWVH